MWKKLIDYLLSEPRQHTMSLFLVLLCAEVFIVGPLSQAGGFHVDLINGIVFSVLLIVGVLAMAPSPLVQAASASVVMIAIAMRWLSTVHGSPQLFLWDRVSSLAAAMVFLALVSWQVFRESPATTHKIRGAVAAYLLIAMIFALLYSIMELLHPGSFFSAVQGMLFSGHRVDTFIYFSISTLTTVGFGDITPAHPLARTLVMLESIIGALYPPILIGILVSLHIDWRRTGDGKRV